MIDPNKLTISTDNPAVVAQALKYLVAGVALTYFSIYDDDALLKEAQNMLNMFIANAGVIEAVRNAHP